MNKPDREHIFSLLCEIESILEQEVKTLELDLKPGLKTRLAFRRSDLKLVRSLKRGRNNQFGFLFPREREIQENRREG